MSGSNDVLASLIPDCSAHCAPATLKNIPNPPLIGLLFHILADPKLKNPPASRLTSDFQPSDPGIIKYSNKKATIHIAAQVHQADNLALPFALLAARTFLPPALLILALKP